MRSSGVYCHFCDAPARGTEVGMLDRAGGEAGAVRASCRRAGSSRPHGARGNPSPTLSRSCRHRVARPLPAVVRPAVSCCRHDPPCCRQPRHPRPPGLADRRPGPARRCPVRASRNTLPLLSRCQFRSTNRWPRGRLASFAVPAHNGPIRPLSTGVGGSQSYRVGWSDDLNDTRQSQA
jgi:hypothetical protein